MSLSSSFAVFNTDGVQQNWWVWGWLTKTSCWVREQIYALKTSRMKATLQGTNVWFALSPGRGLMKYLLRKRGMMAQIVPWNSWIGRKSLNYGPQTENVQREPCCLLNRATGPPFNLNPQTDGEQNLVLMENRKMRLAISQSIETIRICGAYIKLCDGAAWFGQQWGQRHQTQDSTWRKPTASGYTSPGRSSRFLCASFTQHNTASTERLFIAHSETGGEPLLIQCRF